VQDFTEPDSIFYANYQGKDLSLSDRAVRRLVSVAALGEKSAKKLRCKQEGPITAKCAQQFLSFSGRVCYEKKGCTIYEHRNQKKRVD